ncbi:MAG TPA: tetratricopeptide repeat protein [Bryobacteraceae bacterium]|nr:tetratricopeptide repeat protein [Bryobacteraceae bacterium]
MLSTIAVFAFVAVSELSSLYHAQQRSLASRWYDRGAADLKAGRFEAAAGEFRVALLYSRDNYSYQLGLAQALLGAKQSDQAFTYLLNLWERQPENGFVNLELARIASQSGTAEDALRYYHNAIYGAWTSDAGRHTQGARLELIGYLLKNGRKVQAQSELIELAATLGDDPAMQTHVGDLFAQAQDYQDGLAAYRAALRASRNNRQALAGAGKASFELGRYPQAQEYLREAVAGEGGDAESADLLATVELVLRMDPFRRGISDAEEHRLVVQAFAAAGDRLKSCPAASAAAGSKQPSLSDAWTKMKQEVTESGLRRDPDLAESAMELVYSIERQTSAACQPTDVDKALLLIAKSHEGN